MLSFWAELTADEVEAYVCGLILPGYLSHLTLEPLQFRLQAHNFDGRQPLVLRYTGPGRYEEFPLEPAEHLPGLLRRLAAKINPEKIVFPPNDALWNWENSDLTGLSGAVPPLPNERQTDDEQSVLRLFFQPAEPLLGQKADAPYESADAYVSVSRREIFLSFRVIRDYLTACCRALLLPDSPLLTNQTSANTEFFAGTCRFNFGPLFGRLIPDDRTLPEEIARFAHLTKPLEYIADYFDPAAAKCPVRFDEDGLRLKLAEKKSAPCGADQTKV